jgi:hypothetical protein
LIRRFNHFLQSHRHGQFCWALSIHLGRRSIIGMQRRGMGMIPAGQPINDDLKARKFAELQARREPDMNTTVARAGWDGDKSSGWVDPIATNPEFAIPHDIRIDESQRASVLPTSDGLGARAGLIAVALITASGLTWLVISALPSPFASALGARSSGGLNSSAQIPASNKGGRLPISNAFVRDAVSATSRETAVGVAPLELKPSTDAQRRAERDLQAPVKLTPVPETRPTTIEGWTLREVMNGTAVLEGPNGIWHVTRGDTVPGVGRIVSIFRWGNHLMVATSRGLISAP